MAARKNLGLILIAVILSQILVSCSATRTWRLKVGGDRTIAEIEEFREKNARLPRSLGEIGLHVTEEGPHYYKKLSDDRYILWFGTELGESVTYDSAIKKWNK